VAVPIAGQVMKSMLPRLITVLALSVCLVLVPGTSLSKASAQQVSSTAVAPYAAGHVLPLEPFSDDESDRTDCNAIRGGAYRSDTERSWFLASCVSNEPAASAVSQSSFTPNLPAIPGAQVPGERWILVDTENEQMTAMIGNTALYTALVTTGKDGWETPHGTFAILYRVANETMTSASIGAEEDYVLTDVLYTQYFTNQGHAIHDNYWRPDDYFGRVASSHGCVGARLADAEFFWRFATYGTRVTVI